MYRPEGAKPASKEKGTGLHIVTIEPNGQVIWNSAFHTSEIIDEEETTYGMCWEVPNELKMMMTFANLDGMGEGFNPANKLDSSTFELTGDTLKKGLTSALNNSTPGKCIIPEKGDRSKFEEGKNLFVDQDNKCITIDYSNKRSYTEISKGTSESRNAKKLISQWLDSYYMDKDAFMTSISTNDDWTREGKKSTKKGPGDSVVVTVKESLQESFWKHVKVLNDFGVYTTSRGHLDLDLVMKILQFIPEEQRDEFKEFMNKDNKEQEK